MSSLTSPSSSTPSSLDETDQVVLDSRSTCGLPPTPAATGTSGSADAGGGGSTRTSKPGEIWHVYLEDAGNEGYCRERVLNPDGTPKSLSRTFIPAMLADNPRADPKYGARVASIPDRVRRLQLRAGNWLVKTVE